MKKIPTLAGANQYLFYRFEYFRNPPFYVVGYHIPYPPAAYKTGLGDNLISIRMRLDSTQNQRIERYGVVLRMAYLMRY